MSDAHSNDRLTDEELVAYLDGELTPDARRRIAQRIAADHDLQRRLILLSGGNRPFRDAFEPLLEQAPQARLEAMLANLPAARTAEAENTRPTGRWRFGTRAAAASLFLFLVGFGAGWLAPALRQFVRDQIVTETASDEDDWRQAVAEYLSLYTSETLAAIPDDAAMREQEIAAVGAKMGIGLTPQRVALPGLTFKRAQLLEYDRKPLGQIAYLDPDSGPLALCITMNDDPNTGLQIEQRQGFNVVYWSRGRHSFMVIGRVPTPRLQQLASDLSDRLT